MQPEEMTSFPSTAASLTVTILNFYSNRQWASKGRHKSLCFHPHGHPEAEARPLGHCRTQTVVERLGTRPRWQSQEAAGVETKPKFSAKPPWQGLWTRT